jgi:hypothetical protein
VVVLGRAGAGMASVWHIKVFGHKCQVASSGESECSPGGKWIRSERGLMDVLLSPANENISDVTLLFA